MGAGVRREARPESVFGRLNGFSWGTGEQLLAFGQGENERDRGVDVQLIGTVRSERSPEEWDDVVKTAFNGDAGSDLAKKTLASSRYISPPTASVDFVAYLAM